MLQVNPEDRIEMTDLMNCPWICKDEGIPVEATSKYQVGNNSLSFLNTLK